MTSSDCETMPNRDVKNAEYPDPETVLAIRGAIATGHLGGPPGKDGHWLNEFWRLGHELRQQAESLQGFQGTARRGLLCTTTRFLATNEPNFEEHGAGS
ncbi:hypothetical protein L602_001500000080 [Cupriavidus gilardii J11]|uniref:Uncharacterized protein n=1 Tax=Cupriavidus gilardii J11 TaxID=936133 RepID=A0A562BRG2_9BURK|nr:hypothetical protein L602_001500000080 [Cupriavidus gilardii J11]